MDIFKRLIEILKMFGTKKVVAILNKEPVPIPPPPAPKKDNREILFEKALSFIGKDASPSDLAPDEYGCAETVCDILAAAFPGDVGFPLTLSTTQLYRYIVTCDKYKKVDTALKGDIIISPTGYGNGNLANGHVGIKGDGESIMSNHSATGTFEGNYTMESWRIRYVNKGGFPMVCFRRK